MRSLGLFLMALGKRWWALLSSAVFTVIGLYALITGKSNHWVVTVSIAVGVISFLIASFSAWKEQYDARIAAERLNDQSEKAKEIRRKLASIMRQQADLSERLISAQDGAQFSNAVAEVNGWVGQTVALLKDADQPTDAEAFLQAGRVVSAQQVAEYLHVRDWKREEVTRLDLYRKELAQIREKRRF